MAADGTVYFRTKSFKGYGKLSHKNLDEMMSGFRELKVTGEENKEDPSDFVLWKPKKEGEPYSLTAIRLNSLNRLQAATIFLLPITI